MEVNHGQLSDFRRTKWTEFGAIQLLHLCKPCSCFHTLHHQSLASSVSICVIQNQYCTTLYSGRAQLVDQVNCQQPLATTTLVLILLHSGVVPNHRLVLAWRTERKLQSRNKVTCYCYHVECFRMVVRTGNG